MYLMIFEDGEIKSAEEVGDDDIQAAFFSSRTQQKALPPRPTANSGQVECFRLDLNHHPTRKTP